MYPHKFLYLTAGFFALALGLVGIFLPLLPTTPLVLVAAFCFSRSSQRMEAWLLRSRIFGPFIENYRTKQGISITHKIGTLVLLWGGLAVSAWLMGFAWMYVLLAGVGTGVTVHILHIPTKARK